MNIQEIPYGRHNIFNKTEIKSKFNFMILCMLGGYGPNKERNNPQKPLTTMLKAVYLP